MTFAAVFDTSAVVAYTHESQHVGELLQEIGDEGQQVLIPAVCLVEAAVAKADPDRLRLLASHPLVKVAGVGAADWVRLAAGVALLGTLGRACAALLAVEEAAWYVATCDPDVYGGAVDTVLIED